MMTDPPILGTNNMPDGMIPARICASCPAPLGMRWNSRCVMGRRHLDRVLKRGSHRARRCVPGADQADPARTAVGLRDKYSNASPNRASIAGSVSRNWNTISALPGTILAAPGSSVIWPWSNGSLMRDRREPVVDRGGQTNQRHPRVSRRAIRVVPAWFCMPSNTIRNR